MSGLIPHNLPAGGAVGHPEQAGYRSATIDRVELLMVTRRGKVAAASVWVEGVVRSFWT